MNARSRWILVLPILLWLPGCATAPARQTPFMESVLGIDLSRREMQIHAYGFAEHFASVVETAAEEIALASADSGVRRNAILWKMHTIPAVQKAVTSPDPLVGFLESWVLCRQMVRYLEDGPGRDLFGREKGTALTAARLLERDAEEYYGIIQTSGDRTWITDQVRDYAASHPMTGRTFVRDRGAAGAAGYLATQLGGGLAGVGEMNEQMRDALDRLNLYSDFLPRYTRWQGELLLEKLPEQRKG